MPAITKQAAFSGAAALLERGASQTPLGKLLQQCKQTFVFMVVLTYVLEALSLAPMVYMLNVYDRVLSSRSGVTLVSLTTVIIGVYVFWMAVEWIRQRLMVRLSLRIDWDLGPDVFDASFRRYVNRKNINVQQLLGDLQSLRQFFTGPSVLTLMDAPFAIVFIFIGALFHPCLLYTSPSPRDRTRSRMPSSA